MIPTIRAIYTLLKDTIPEDAKWWKDAALVDKLDKEVVQFLGDKDPGYSLAELKDTIAKRANQKGECMKLLHYT